MRCPQCQTENRANRKFCAACGAALERACGTCGFKNALPDRFCGGFSRPLPESASPAKPANQASRPRRTKTTVAMRVHSVGRLFRSALLTIIALSASACLSEPEIYCETFAYNGSHVLLAVPSAYYLLPRTERGGISLRFRYRDFAAIGTAYADFDRDELKDPDWTLEKSNYPALLQIDRINLSPSTRVEDFKAGAPNLREIPSDWEGWTKLEICPHSCSEHFYLSDKWREAGVSNVGCYEVEGRDPKYMGCAARDSIRGLRVTYYFPVTKKAHFAEFRARVTEFIDKMAENAKTACRASQQTVR